MISAIRVEAVADDPAQAKAEIDTILTHMRDIGHLEGIVPQCGEMKGEVYDAREAEDYIRGEAGGRFWFPFAGRKIVSFMPEEHPHNTPQMPREQNGYEVKYGDKDVTKEKLVTDRLLPMDWPQQFRPRPFVDEAETVLYELRQMGMTYTIKPLPEPSSSSVTFTSTTGFEPLPGTSSASTADRWRIDVEYSDGKAGYHSCGPTILAAAIDALKQAMEIHDTPDPAGGNHTFSGGTGFEIKSSG